MTDRLLLALAVLAIILLAGHLIRRTVAARSALLAGRARLSPDGASRLMLFSSPWCGDCQAQRQVIESERDRLPQPVEISYHDVLQEGELARRFGILTVPALVVAAPDGRVVGVRQGLVEADRLRSLLAAAG